MFVGNGTSPTLTVVSPRGMTKDIVLLLNRERHHQKPEDPQSQAHHGFLAAGSLHPQGALSKIKP